MEAAKKAEIFALLQNEILRLEGFKTHNNSSVDSSLRPILDTFPNKTFPLGCVHEFLSSEADTPARDGFIASILSLLLGASGIAVWIGKGCSVFPPGLKSFGVRPDRIIFINAPSDRYLHWILEEVLKCEAITAVIGEVDEFSFTASRRLQLTVEKSHVTAFILRNSKREPNQTACVSRWKIKQLPSDQPEGLPGIGFPKWRVELLRVRNGKTGVWEIAWENRIKFLSLPTWQQEQAPSQLHKALILNKRKAG